jgi:VCBS repeat-containing protein
MATSGKYDGTYNRDEIIQEALELITVYDPGVTLSAEDITTCARSLRFMLQAWRADDVGLWANKEAFLFPQKTAYAFDLGPTGDHCSLNAVKTELASSAAASASSIVIDSTTGMSDNYDRNGICTAQTPAASGALTMAGALVVDSMAYLPSQRPVLVYSSGNDSTVTFTITGTDAAGAAVTETITGPNTTTVYTTKTFATVTVVYISDAGTGSIEVGCVGDNIGIQLDTGALHWTYIAGALSTTLTLVTVLASAASVDNHVYVYDKEIQRPVDIIEARRRRADGKDVPLILISRDKYERFSDKTTGGTINSVYYDPQRINGVLYSWPSCNDVQEYIVMTVRYPLEDVISGTDNFDLPPEWMEAIAWNLGTRIAPKYSKDLSSEFTIRAEAMYQTLKGHDRENSSIFIEIVR